jgi:hypothetical protein
MGLEYRGCPLPSRALPMTARAQDYAEMLAAADDWGPQHDPERRWFLAGWRDQIDGRRGENRPPETELAALCGYNSGVIAARDGQP